MGFIETAYSGNASLSTLDINADLDLKGVYNAIGIKRLICDDYMGALLTTPSDNVRETLELGDFTHNTQGPTKSFRIPSNFVSGSKIKIGFTAYSSTNSTLYINKYDPDTETYTTVQTETVNTSGNIEWFYFELSVKGGEIYQFNNGKVGSVYLPYIYGDTYGFKMCYDYSVINGAVWEVIP